MFTESSLIPLNCSSITLTKTKIFVTLYVCVCVCVRAKCTRNVALHVMCQEMARKRSTFALTVSALGRNLVVPTKEVEGKQKRKLLVAFPHRAHTLKTGPCACVCASPVKCTVSPWFASTILSWNWSGWLAGLIRSRKSCREWWWS